MQAFDSSQKPGGELSCQGISARFALTMSVLGIFPVPARDHHYTHAHTHSVSLFLSSLTVITRTLSHACARIARGIVSIETTLKNMRIALRSCLFYEQGKEGR